MIGDVTTAAGKIVQDKCFELHRACCAAECPCFVLGRLPPRASLHICGAHLNRAKREPRACTWEGNHCKLQGSTEVYACSNAENHLRCKRMPVEAEDQGTRVETQDSTVVHQRSAPLLMRGGHWQQENLLPCLQTGVLPASTHERDGFV